MTSRKQNPKPNDREDDDNGQNDVDTGSAACHLCNLWQHQSVSLWHGPIVLQLQSERNMEGFMAMLKVIEVLAESKKSWEDAAQEAVATAGKTVRGIRSINIKNLQANVDDGKITSYRVNAKISFTLE